MHLLLVVLLVFVELTGECPVEPVLPLRLCEVVWWDCCVFRRRSWCFGESDWSVVGMLCPLHCGAVEREVHLVQKMVVQVESVQRTGGVDSFVCVVWLMHQGKVVWCK